MTSDIRVVRSRGPDLDEQRRQRRQLINRPMWRFFENHEHLALDNLVREQPQPNPAESTPQGDGTTVLEALLAAEAAEQERERREEHSVRVFDPAALAQAREVLGNKPANTRDATAHARSAACLDRAARDEGWRSVPWAGPQALYNPFAILAGQEEYANFREVLQHLSVQWTLANRAHAATDARIDPILLTGDPGVGKIILPLRSPDRSA